MAEIASAFVTIAPSMRGFRGKVTAEASASGDAAGSSFGRNFGSRSLASAKGAGAAFGKAFAAGAAVAATAGGLFLKGAVDEAAKLEQSVGGIKAVFKGTAGEMLSFSKTAAKSVGLSQNEFNELGLVIGSQLKNGGTAMEELAPKTQNLIRLGADLSSMFGGTSREAVEALSSALKGERDPIERYGVSLNQTKIDAEAAALGYKKVGKSFDAQAVQAATLSLIMKQTADAQGNFARESDTLAGKQQTLGARFSNLKARIGTALLPVVVSMIDTFQQRVVPMFNDVVDAIKPVVSEIKDRLQPVFEKVTGFLKDNPEVVKGAAIALGVLAIALGAVALAMGAVALATSPITLIVLGVAALGAAIAYAYKNSSTFRSIVQAVGAKLKEFGAYVMSTVVPAVVDLAQKVGANLKPVLEAVGSFIRDTIIPVVKQIAQKFAEWWPTIQQVIGVVASLVAKLVEFYSKVYGAVIPVILQVAGFFIRTLVPAVMAAVGVLVSIVKAVIRVGAGFVDAAKKVGDFAKKVGEKIGDVIGFVKDLPGKAKNAVGDLGKTLFESGKKLIGGFIDGLKEKAKDITGAAKGIVSKVVPFFPQSPVKKGPLRAFNKGKTGKKLMSMFAGGLKGGAGGVVTAMEGVTGRISAIVGDKKLPKKAGKRLQRVVDVVSSKAQKVQDLLGARNDMATSVASGLGGEFNLSELTATNQFGLSTGSGGAASAAAGLVARMRAFAEKLKALIARGLPSALVNEIAGYGSKEGARVADVFLQGSQADTNAIGQAYRDFSAVTAGIGSTVADATYGADLGQAQADLAAIVAQALRDFAENASVKVNVNASTAAKITKAGNKRTKRRK